MLRALLSAAALLLVTSAAAQLGAGDQDGERHGRVTARLGGS